MSVYKITFPNGSTATYATEEQYLRGLRNEYLLNQFKTGKVEQYHDELVVSDLDYASLEDRVLANMHDRKAKACEVFYNQLTKEEDSMNNNTNERQVILNLVSLIADNTPEGMEVCKEKSTEDTVVFKKKVKSTRWEDLGGIRGYYTDEYSDVEYYHRSNPDKVNSNVYATQPQCKAHLAQAQLSQIMKEVNGDWEADWRDDSQTKYAIILFVFGYDVGEYTTLRKFLAFKSQELAEQVMRENTDLLEQYKPLVG